MGIIGIARDLAAHFNLPFTDSELQVVPGSQIDGVSAVVEAVRSLPPASSCERRR